MYYYCVCISQYIWLATTANGLCDGEALFAVAIRSLKCRRNYGSFFLATDASVGEQIERIMKGKDPPLPSFRGTKTKSPRPISFQSQRTLGVHVHTPMTIHT